MTREETLIARVHAYCKSFLTRSIYGECKAFCPFSDSELPKCSQRYIHEHPDDVERILNEEERQPERLPVREQSKLAIKRARRSSSKGSESRADNAR